MLNLPPKPVHVIQKFLHEYKHIVYKYTVKKVLHGIQEDLAKVELFQINSAQGKQVAVVSSHNYELVLSDALKSAISVEDYELAGKIRDIISLLRLKSINKLLSDDTTITEE